MAKNLVVYWLLLPGKKKENDLWLKTLVFRHSVFNSVPPA
jgi:hypothetical protein